jgi:hypothetical protein
MAHKITNYVRELNSNILFVFFRLPGPQRGVEKINVMTPAFWIRVKKR